MSVPVLQLREQPVAPTFSVTAQRLAVAQEHGPVLRRRIRDSSETMLGLVNGPEAISPRACGFVASTGEFVSLDFEIVLTAPTMEAKDVLWRHAGLACSVGATPARTTSSLDRGHVIGTGGAVRRCGTGSIRADPWAVYRGEVRTLYADARIVFEAVPIVHAIGTWKMSARAGVQPATTLLRPSRAARAGGDDPHRVADRGRRGGVFPLLPPDVAEARALLERAGDDFGSRPTAVLICGGWSTRCAASGKPAEDGSSGCDTGWRASSASGPTICRGQHGSSRASSTEQRGTEASAAVGTVRFVGNVFEERRRA